MAALRDAGLPCSEGRLYYRGNGIHTVIAWTDELKRFLRAVVAEATRVRSLPIAPDPLKVQPQVHRLFAARGLPARQAPRTQGRGRGARAPPDPAHSPVGTTTPLST